jgi:hypothetical protein
VTIFYKRNEEFRRRSGRRKEVFFFDVFPLGLPSAKDTTKTQEIDFDHPALTRRTSMGETKRQSYTFTVREYGDGTPYIACVPVGREWSVFGKGSLSFVLPMGTTLKIAKKAGAFLNKNIDLISFTETLGPDKYSRRRA